MTPKSKEDTTEDLRVRARAWVERSCAEQGVPVKISNPATIRYVAAILRGENPEPPWQRRRT
jgi:hypothetical protein